MKNRRGSSKNLRHIFNISNITQHDNSLVQLLDNSSKNCAFQVRLLKLIMGLYQSKLNTDYMVDGCASITISKLISEFYLRARGCTREHFVVTCIQAYVQGYSKSREEFHVEKGVESVLADIRS